MVIINISTNAIFDGLELNENIRGAIVVREFWEFEDGPKIMPLNLKLFIDIEEVRSHEP